MYALACSHDTVLVRVVSSYLGHSECGHNECANAMYVFKHKYKLCMYCPAHVVLLSRLSHSHCIHFEIACKDHDLQDCAPCIALTFQEQAVAMLGYCHNYTA